MKKSVSIIAAAAMAASLTLAGSVNVFAAEETVATEPATTAVEATEAATEAATEVATAVAQAPTAAATEAAAPALDVKQFAGNWKLQVAEANSTVDTNAKDSGTVVINSDGSFTYTDLAGGTQSGTIKLGTEEIAGTTVNTVGLYSGETLLYGGYYTAGSDVINIGNGGQARLIRDNAATPATQAATAAATTAAATTAKPATTTKAATTAANSGNKTNSPKTGVAFPALSLAGMTAAVAVAFSLRKKED